MRRARRLASLAGDSRRRESARVGSSAVPQWSLSVPKLQPQPAPTRVPPCQLFPPSCGVRSRYQMPKSFRVMERRVAKGRQRIQWSLGMHEGNLVGQQCCWTETIVIGSSAEWGFQAAGGPSSPVMSQEPLCPNCVHCGFTAMEIQHGHRLSPSRTLTGHGNALHLGQQTPVTN